MKKAYLFIPMIFALLLSACASTPPRYQLNVCKIFKKYPKWYWATIDAQKKWGVPIYVQMAIIHQESHFHAHIRPKRVKLLWVIPWSHVTTASGYTQALDGTWRAYLRETGQHGASRHSFDKATDFIGWFAYRAHRQLGISQQNAYAVYLAYHEGINGYRYRTYRNNSALKRIALNVQTTANQYRYQLSRCERSLPKKHWWSFL